MKKKILAAIVAGLICVSAVGCDDGNTTYQEATNTFEDDNELAHIEGHIEGDLCNGYFSRLTKWKDEGATYYIVYANDTKVKYFMYFGIKRFGITPLYNADGTLQIYDGE
jgi:hypothetical protein|nr:MAG TPA: putative peptidyl-prolyl cis-trans isomerase [Bacteriophage sp.]